MASIKESLGGTAVLTSVIAAAVTNYAATETTVAVNTSNLYLDANLIVRIQMGGTAATGDSWILLSSSLDGTNFSTPATGSAAAITIPQIDKLGGEQTGQFHAGTNLVVLGKMNMNGTATTATATANFGSIAQAFGGNLMPQWGAVVVNATGTAYGTTTANNIVWYDGVFATSV